MIYLSKKKNKPEERNETENKKFNNIKISSFLKLST